MQKVQDLLDNAEFEFEKYRKAHPNDEAVINLRMSLRYLQLAIQEVLATADSTSYVLNCLLNDVKPSEKPITYEEAFGDSSEAK